MNFGSDLCDDVLKLLKGIRYEQKAGRFPSTPQSFKQRAAQEQVQAREQLDARRYGRR